MPMRRKSTEGSLLDIAKLCDALAARPPKEVDEFMRDFNSMIAEARHLRECYDAEDRAYRAEKQRTRHAGKNVSNLNIKGELDAGTE